jgi:glycine oxidase
MNPSDRLRAEIAVIGAGITGLAVAYELRKRGADVSLFDQAQAARGTSWASAGMLAPYKEAEADQALLRLGQYSLEHYPTFVQELREISGVDVWLRRDGHIELAFDASDAERLERMSIAIKNAGGRTSILSRQETLLCEPLVSRDVIFALCRDDEGQVDNRRLGRALVAACQKLGVRIYTNVDGITLKTNGRRVLGISSNTGFLGTRTVINAMGPWAGQLAGVPDSITVPVRPVKGQILALAMPSHAIRRVIWAADIYLVPRQDGRLLVGATVEEVGYDTRVTAQGILNLLRCATRTAPALGNFAITETWAGLRPATHDARPYLGSTALDGYLIAAGHYRNGILLAPATAMILADLIEGRQTALDIGAFSPTRVAGAIDGAQNVKLDVTG